ncbi:MAG: hypothetical protein SGJ15_01465 [Bacteroidota bacterium]|nr:hypothetical protein [Bacteroidota bacterium]
MKTKTTSSRRTVVVLILAVLIFGACKKDKKTTPPPIIPPPPANTEEVITTMKLYLTDSATSVVSIVGFEDADGDGGNAGIFLGTNQSDSIFTLGGNKTYFMEIILLDVTKNPVDTISNEVEQEGKDHMFFFNSSNPTGTPFSTVLSGSNMKVTYTDLDAGTPTRGIGLKTRLRTYASTGSAKNLFTITLKHQPGVKDGTFAPGDSDVEVGFKVMVN